MLKSVRTIGLILLFLALLVSFFAQDSTSLDMQRVFAKASFVAPFGYDHYGRNVLLLSIAGLRQSFLLAALAVFFGASTGTLIAVLSTRVYHGALNSTVTQLNNLIFAFPAFITALLLTSYAQSSGLDWLKAMRHNGMLAMIAIALFNVPVFAQIVRGRAAQLWQKPYVQVAQLAGHSHLYCALKHVLPNVLAPVFVHSATQMAMALIVEASLSFLGLGVSAPAASLGRQIAEVRSYIAIEPQLVITPSLVLLGAILVLVVTADSLARFFDLKTERLL